jgi:Fic family protein
MRRRATGQYRTISAASERFRAFVPMPLPPKPPLVWSPALRRRFDDALLALGRLDAVTALLPNASLLLYSFVRKEAVLSSQIEGTQSSLADLLLYEIDEQPGVPVDDVREVSRCVAALEFGLNKLRSGFPLCMRLLCDMHEVLMAHPRAGGKTPGQIRRSQVWIGGTRPGNAVFVPPPVDALPEALKHFERFLNDEPEPVPPLIKAALAHVQFETIHPFLDGNGRIGRLLIVLQLIADGTLREPMLYPSLFFKRHRALYYDLLNAVRVDGDWERWLDFFAEGIEACATQGVATANALLHLAGERRSGPHRGPRTRGAVGARRPSGLATATHCHVRRPGRGHRPDRGDGEQVSRTPGDTRHRQGVDQPPARARLQLPPLHRKSHRRAGAVIVSYFDYLFGASVTRSSRAPNGMGFLPAD